MSDVSLPPEISLTKVASVAALGARWRALEVQAEAGFFRSWGFLEEQAARFTEPHLLAVRQGGADVALALLNLHCGRLHVGETGDPRHDALFVEHNGVLVRQGADAVLAPALAKLCAVRPVVLSGVDAAHARAARSVGVVVLHAERFAPYVDLRAMTDVYLGGLSANARAQISRSMRGYGPDIKIQRAPDVATALAWFAALVRLHNARWHALGKPGAFATQDLLGFHEALIRRLHAAGQADILRISAGAQDIGYLYNVRHGGWVMNYQSGLVAAPHPRQKPGLVCHSLAIDYYRDAGERQYDLLAGAQRYKTTLAPEAGRQLVWLTLYSRFSTIGWGRSLMARARNALARRSQVR